MKKATRTFLFFCVSKPLFFSLKVSFLVKVFTDVFALF